MIDFRYHLVSLVAVFIALAVGIALGAGPLREGISSTLESEVAQLRDERADLRAQVDDATRRADVKDEAVAVLSETILPGTLDGSRVGLVLLPGADRNVLGELEDRLELAGADVVLMVEVDNRAGDLEPPPERVELLERLASTLDVPDVGDGTGPTAAGVLAATLAGADGVGAVGAWLEAAEEMESAGLVDLTWRQETAVGLTDRRPPDVLVIESGGLSVEAAEEQPGVERLGLRLELVAALAALETPTVVTATGGETLSDAGVETVDPLVTAVREDEDLAEEVSTVDNLESVSGQVAAAMAVAWELDGQAGHYGVGGQAQTALPAVPRTRTPSGGGVPGVGGPTPTAPVPDDASSTTAP
ncbi:copper transporter [Ornithinimicrobium cerasi]|uniref:copper transporter n=1 Tax=Ornithinimicrobium cerasi TaxID=2248773 RepID=UPI000EFECF99|nr:copper transporter [Ornithinimicrobium cerasi]